MPPSISSALAEGCALLSNDPVRAVVLLDDERVVVHPRRPRGVQPRHFLRRLPRPDVDDVDAADEGSPRPDPHVQGTEVPIGDPRSVGRPARGPDPPWLPIDD